MKKLILVGLLLCGFLSVSAFAESLPLQITEGRFFIKGNQTEEAGNAWMKTPMFSASSYLGGDYSPWTDICKRTPKSCGFGKTFVVPERPDVNLGGCVGCSGPQFPQGAFTIGEKTYQNAYFRGGFKFSRETFLIPKRVKRKGMVMFRKPFTMTGNLFVCQVSEINAPCPADKILFNGEVAGKGSLTVTTEIRVWDDGVSNYPYLFQKSFEYRFER